MEKLPHYKKLHLDLKGQIVSGQIPKGSLLPSENELSNTYNITRATVRQALQELVKEGFIEKRMGLGSVVVSSRKTLGLLTFRGFSEVMESSTLTSTTHTLSRKSMASWPQPFFHSLSMEERQAGCFYLERVRHVEGNPVMLEQTYVPRMALDNFWGLVGDSSLFGTLAQSYQIEILQVLQDIRAIPAPDSIRNALRLPEKVPLLHIHRKYLTNRPRFHVYSSLYCHTEKYTISNFFN